MKLHQRNCDKWCRSSKKPPSFHFFVRHPRLSATLTLLWDVHLLYNFSFDICIKEMKSFKWSQLSIPPNLFSFKSNLFSFLGEAAPRFQGSLQSFGVEQIGPKMTVLEYLVHLEEAIRELGRSHLRESCGWEGFFARSHPPEGRSLARFGFVPLSSLRGLSDQPYWINLSDSRPKDNKSTFS